MLDSGINEFNAQKMNLLSYFLATFLDAWCQVIIMPAVDGQLACLCCEGPLLLKFSR